MSETATPSAPVAECCAETILERWLGACEANPFDPLTREAAQPYAVIWRLWVQHIAPVPWQQASAAQALDFVNQIDGMYAPVPSDISRRRYWRLLDRIYDFAMLHGLCLSNPAQEIAESQRPPCEVSLAAILTPRLWGALPDNLPPDLTAGSARNRAILSVLIDTACAPGELTNIRMQDLRYDENGLVSAIYINGQRKYEKRTLPVSESTAMLLCEWLEARRLYGQNAALEWLFLSRSKGGKMRPFKLHTIVAQALRYCALICRLPEPPRAGGQIIRNTAIVYWLLSGVSMHDVIARAGIKSIKGMSHLRLHLPPHLRQAISASPPG